MIPRRVLLTTDVVGGVWDFCTTLARSLGGDADVTLLALGEPSAAQRQAARGIDVRSVALRLEWMQDSGQDIARTREVVRDLARQTRAEVVHANQFAAACADVNVPVVLTVHSDVLSWRRATLQSEHVPPEWGTYVALVNEALTRADSAVAVSAFLAREVGALYHTPRHLGVIHNGWPTAASVARKEPFTLVAGRIWDQAKNVILAAEAAQGEVYVAGEQRHPDGGMVDVPSTLRSLGQLSQHALQGWLARAAIYLSPARYDPFGLLPLQAALHGCALLLSDIPSYRELWDGAACFFRGNDADDLRERWRTLLEDEALRTRLAQAARTRAETRYSAERMARQYRELYATSRRRVAA